MMGSKEFQPLIMAAGKGSRMTELTTRRPKCLLPIGNQPMVWYPIRMLEKSGFSDVIVVVHESVKSEVQSSLDLTSLKIHVEFLGVAVGEDWGTADTLRHLYENHKIKSDVVVLSCDLVTDVDLSGLLNQFRQHDASLAALFCQPTLPTHNYPTPGPKSKDQTERDIVAFDPATSRLVFLASASDFEETLSLSRGLIRKHGRVKLYSRLLDAHVYVMKRWMCQYLTHNRNMSTLKGELIPYAVKKQYTRPPSSQDKAASVIVSPPKTELIDLAVENDLVLKVREISNFSDHRGDQSGAYHGDVIRCYATITPDTVFAARVNTLQEYCRINREIVKRWGDLCGSPSIVHVSPKASVLSTQLDTESCLVGDGATVSERTSVKASVLGPHSLVKPRTQVLNSILMAGAKVGEKCVVVNCVLCEYAEVEDGCELKNCLVGSRHTVAAGEKHSSEVLTDDVHLLEII